MFIHTFWEVQAQHHVTEPYKADKVEYEENNGVREARLTKATTGESLG